MNTHNISTTDDRESQTPPSGLRVDEQVVQQRLQTSRAAQANARRFFDRTEDT